MVYAPNLTTTATGDTTAYVRRNTNSTADDNISYSITVNSRELSQIKVTVESCQFIAADVQYKFEILEKKFNKAIEILTSRGINITEMI
jgi:hypothetical protein